MNTIEFLRMALINIWNQLSKIFDLQNSETSKIMLAIIILFISMQRDQYLHLWGNVHSSSMSFYQLEDLSMIIIMINNSGRLIIQYLGSCLLEVFPQSREWSETLIQMAQISTLSNIPQETRNTWMILTSNWWLNPKILFIVWFR